MKNVWFKNTEFVRNAADDKWKMKNLERELNRAQIQGINILKWISASISSRQPPFNSESPILIINQKRCLKGRFFFQKLAPESQLLKKYDTEHFFESDLAIVSIRLAWTCHPVSYFNVLNLLAKQKRHAFFHARLRTK